MSPRRMVMSFCTNKDIKEKKNCFVTSYKYVFSTSSIYLFDANDLSLVFKRIFVIPRTRF